MPSASLRAFWSAVVDVKLEGVDLHDISGRGPDDIFAVGEDGMIARFDGVGWSRHIVGQEDHLGVEADGQRGVIAVGAGGAIHRLDGSAWRQEESSTTSDLRAVEWSASGEPFVFGAHGTMLVHQHSMSPVR